MITTRLPLSDDLKIQDSATADDLNYQRLLSADQSLASEDLFICLIILYAQKDNHALSDKYKERFLTAPAVLLRL